MTRDTPITPPKHIIDQPSNKTLHNFEDNEPKLHILKTKLEAGEISPVVNNFDREIFITKLHQKYLK